MKKTTLLAHLLQNVFENAKKELISFFVLLVENHSPSYQGPFAKCLQVIDRKRNQPLVSISYSFITFCELLRLPYKVNLCPYFIIVC